VPQNVEIKARLAAGESGRIREIALAHAGAPPEAIRQRDTFYRAASGRLKLREFGDGTGELIAYERPDRAGPKTSSYVRSPTAEPASLHTALARSLGVRGVVAKRREGVLVGQTGGHLAEVEGRGSFLELEVVLKDGQSAAEGEAIAADLMRLFDVAPASLVEGAYMDLLEAGAKDGDRT